MPSLSALNLLRALVDAGVRFFAGIPDSVLANLCFAIDDEIPAARHVMAANEGGAIAAAAGHYLATGGVPAVYLQNSGLGNALNPLISLASPEVAAIPMLLLVGWRGEPGAGDEVEHALQGRITIPLLELVGIESVVLPDDERGAVACVGALIERARHLRAPVAAVLRPGRLAPAARPVRSGGGELPLTRERAIAIVLDAISGASIVISTTGKASRELWDLRARAGESHDRDFLMVGSMGHASQIALGLALGRSSRPVVCLDGDAAATMHMGSLAVIGASCAANLRHFVLHNGAHDSVGGHRSAAAGRSFAAIASACGYRWTSAAADEPSLRAGIAAMLAQPGPSLLEVQVRRGARADLGRPRQTPAENAAALRARLDAEGDPS